MSPQKALAISKGQRGMLCVRRNKKTNKNIYNIDREKGGDAIKAWTKQQREKARQKKKDAEQREWLKRTGDKQRERVASGESVQGRSVKPPEPKSEPMPEEEKPKEQEVKPEKTLTQQLLEKVKDPKRTTRYLLSQETLTPRQDAAARKILIDAGLATKDDFPPSEYRESSGHDHGAYVSGDLLKFGLKWGGTDFDKIKSVLKDSGAKFDGSTTTWNLPIAKAAKLFPEGHEIWDEIGISAFGMEAIDAAKGEGKQAAEKKEKEKAEGEEKQKDIIDEAVRAGMFPYQGEGVAFLKGKKFALLADEMGTGKTIQAISALKGENAPVVVVSPASLKHNWAKEFSKWAPEYKSSVLAGRDSFRAPAPGEVVITNYAILADNPGQLPPGTTVIFDEAQALKGRAKTTKQVERANALSKLADRVWGLTGTPIMSRPFDLWGVLTSLRLEKEVFGGSGNPWGTFLRAFNAKKNKWGGYEFGNPSPEVKDRLRKVMLRRRRADVLPELPPKQRENIVIGDLPAAVRKMADKINKEVSSDLERGVLPSFEKMSKVRAALAQARIPAMLEHVEMFEESNTPSIVFSAHRAPVDVLSTRAGWATITGDTPSERRQQIVDDFQAGKLKGVGITIAAGGTGLTLTRANHVLFVDRDWTPSANAQAEDRVARIGQEANKIHITNLVSDHPLDHRVNEILAAKEQMIEAAIEKYQARRRAIRMALARKILRFHGKKRGRLT